MFEVDCGFCYECGTVLPPSDVSTFVTCYGCGKKFSFRDFGRMKSNYTVHFNSVENIDFARKTSDSGESSSRPAIERICRKCGHNQMSYLAMQLRSADEGQTVFYTCLKCKFTESENS